MRRGLTTLGLLSVVLFSGGASAAAPSFYVDDSSLFLSLHTAVDSAARKSAYQFDTAGWLRGTTVIPKQDAIRVDWKQGGKVLASQRCQFTDFDDDGKSGGFRCELEKATLTAAGNIDVDISYVDDRADTTTVVRTLKVTVNRYFVWSGMDGNKPIHDTYYQVDGSDLLGGNWLWLGGAMNVKFLTWMSRDKNDRINNLGLRCSVNGKMLPDDLPAWAGYQTDLVAGRSRHWAGGSAEDEKVRGWVRMEVSAELYRGPRGNQFKNEPKMIYLTEHAGAWSCQLRDQGTVLREWKFTVDAKGDVVRHAEQAGWPLHPNMRFVETTFSKAAWDEVFNPDAIKKSVMFGRPWSNPASLKGMFDALPPAKDVAVPNPPAGGAPPATAATKPPATAKKKKK
jgi:hypothetical protein